MDDKMMQQPAEAEELLNVQEETPMEASEENPEEVVLAEQESEEGPSADELLRDSLKEEIRLFQEKEKVLTEKICLAKDKGMHVQADQCRILLQKIVREKIAKRDELKIVEDRIRETENKKFMERFTKEVDELTTNIEAEIFGHYDDEVEEEEEPVFEPEFDHAGKAKRLSVISKAFGWLGVLAGLIGALVYMVLVEFNWAVFSWMGLGTFGIVAVVMIIVGVCIGKASNKHKRLAAEDAVRIAEMKAQYEAERLERQRLAEEAKKARDTVDSTEAISEAYAIEKAGDNKRAVKKQLQKLIPDLSNTEELKKNVHKIAPIAAACAAVTVMAVAAGSKKRAAAKKSAAIRREFFDWMLG